MFSVHVLSSRGIRTFIKSKKLNFSPLVKNKDTKRTFLDNTKLLKPTATGGGGGSMYVRKVQAMENSSSLNSRDDDVLVGDPKLIQNGVMVLSADIAKKWKENNIQKQWRKNVYNLATNIIISH